MDYLEESAFPWTIQMRVFMLEVAFFKEINTYIEHDSDFAIILAATRTLKSVESVCVSLKQVCRHHLNL